MTKIALPETFLSLKSKIHRRNILGAILKFLATLRPSRRKHTGKKTLPREKRKLRHYYTQIHINIASKSAIGVESDGMELSPTIKPFGILKFRMPSS